MLKLVKIFLNVDSSLNEIEKIFKDKCYNQSEVIDLVSDNCIYDILTHPNWEMLVQSYWSGPYINKSFMSSSFSFNILFDQSKPELEYSRINVG